MFRSVHVIFLSNSHSLTIRLQSALPYTMASIPAAEQKSQPIPDVAAEAVLGVAVEDIPNTAAVRGYDFNLGVDYDAILRSYATTGFQATNMWAAIDEINRMRSWRLSDEPVKESDGDDFQTEEQRKAVKTKQVLGWQRCRSLPPSACPARPGTCCRD